VFLSFTSSLIDLQDEQWKTMSAATLGLTLTQLQWYQASQPSQQTQDIFPSGLLHRSAPMAQALILDVFLAFVPLLSLVLDFPLAIFLSEFSSTSR